LTCLTKPSIIALREHPSMIAPVSQLRIWTVPPRPHPAAKGRGRPVGTPLTPLEGLGDPRGETSAGLAPARTWLVVVELEDADGVTGVGTAGFGNPAAVEILRQLERLVIGRVPTDVAQIWEVMYRSTLNIGRRGVVLHAISAIDIALWDLLGKQLGLPVHSLLGGKQRPSLPAYASWLYATEDLDALAAEAASWAGQGFTAVKQRLSNGPADGRAGISKNVALVRTVVDAVGPDVDVMADAYMSWDVGYAVRCIRAIEDEGIRLRWIEEPTIPDDVRGLARIRAAVSTPVAAGEHEATRFGFRDLVTAGAVDVLQPDVNRLGGITEARRVWALGETFGLDVVPHLGFAHNAQLAAASLATPLLEYLPPPASSDEADEDQIFWVAFPDEPRAENGRIVLPDRPGLGVSLDMSVLDPASA
jgi:L-alanine-DL-glutamate epimerase-like enolase superfamily enzyme